MYICKPWCLRLVRIALMFLASMTAVQAALEVYEYDPAGRLKRIVADGGSRITRYTYDAMGNLVSVRVVHSEFPPTILSVAPESLRAGDSATVRITGANLAAASVISPETRFYISELTSADSTLSFLLSLPPDAPPGEQLFRVHNPDGDASFGLNILPPLPRLSAAPLPLALPDDGSTRRFLLRLSRADVLDRSIALSLSNTGIAELESAQITIPAGESEMLAGIRGLTGGVTLLTLASEGLQARSYSVYVTADFGAINSRHSTLLGVMVGEVQGPIGAVYSDWTNTLGLVVGPYIEFIEPAALAVGSETQPLTVHGVGLTAVDGLSVRPGDGISLSGFETSADGSSVSVLATIAADAATGLRQVILNGPDGPYRTAAPGADRVNITPPRPQLDSISPNFAVQGDSRLSLTIRGRNLAQASAVSFDPPDGILVGSNLQSGAGGTSLRFTLSIAADASASARTVTVTTPAGTSSSQASAANTFHVVNQVAAVYQPIASPLLGVRVGGDDGAQPRTVSNYSPSLGVVRGPMAYGMDPGHGEKGSALQLTINGVGLDTATALAFEPGDGIGIDNFTAGTDGTSLTAQLNITPDAPETWHRLRLFRNTAETPFANTRASLFLVTGPIPEIASVSPNSLRIGSGSKTITLIGSNLDRASGVSAEPADGLQIGTPVVSGGGTRLTVSIEAQASAAAGTRVLSVTTPAGSSTQTASPANTLSLYQQALASPDPLLAPLLGVTVGGMTGDGELSVDALSSPLLGMQVGEAGGGTGSISSMAAASLGVIAGPYAIGLHAPPLLLGDTYTLSVIGHGLDQVDGAGVFPGLDLSLGAPVPTADGASLLLSLTIPADAVMENRQLRLVAGTTPVPFADPSWARLAIAAGVPEIESISPITIRPGEVAELIIRGRHLQNARQVIAEPANGVLFASSLSATGDGSEIRVRIHVPDDAPPGTRTIRVETPGGATTDQASPANTLTLF